MKSSSNKCLSCEERACIRIDDKNVCLLHFSISKHAVDYTNHIKKQKKSTIKNNNSNNNNNKIPLIIDHNVLDNQKNNVQDLWKEIIGDVILKMFDFQQEEQDILRKDPLAIIQLESNPINRGTFTIRDEITNPNENNNNKKNIIKTANNIVKQSSSSGTKLKRLSYTPDENDEDNPYIKKRTASKSIWHTGLTIKEKEEQLKKIKEREAEEEKNATGDECPSCNSKWTDIRIDGAAFDISKNETWGGISATTEVKRFYCKSCGYCSVLE